MRFGKDKWRFFLLTTLLLMAWPGFTAGREAMSATIGWPSDAGGWKRAGEAVPYAGRAIFSYMDGAGEVFLAFNFKRLAVQRFERGGHPAIVAEVYEMGTPEDAFGIFAWDRQDPDAAIGQGSEFGGGLLRFWKGRYFVSVYGEGEGKEQEQAVLEVGRKIASLIVEEGGPPRLLETLPKERRAEGSVRFVRSHVLLNQRCFVSNENILGLASDTEAIFARYDLGKERTFLLIVAYPTAERARSAMVELKKAYRLDTEGMREAEGAWTGAEVEGHDLVVAFHTPEADAARRLIGAVKAALKEER